MLNFPTFTNIFRHVLSLKGKLHKNTIPRKIVDYISSPIINHLRLFFSLIILQSLSGLIYTVFYSFGFTITEKLTCGLVILTYSIIAAYIILFIQKLLSKKLGAVFVIASILLISLYQLVNIFCIFTLHISYSLEFGSIIAGTNTKEVNEFLETYINTTVIFEYVLFILGLAILLFAAKIMASRLEILAHKFKFKVIQVAILIICVPLCYCNKQEVYPISQSIFGVYWIFSSYEKVDKINPTNPKLNLSEKTSVPTLVVVIGESFSKLHSSLYGYEKTTNPRLAAMPDSLLHVFKNVEASDTHTITAFSSFMTTSETADIPNCYKCPNVIEIAKKSGYNTVWISNQSKTGRYDNKVSIFAHLCDTTIWNGDKFAGLQKNDLDEEILPYVTGFRNKLDKSVFFIHLMGSHGAFFKRYPTSYDKFKSNDYLRYKESQRQTLAQYDNSVLYNDYIVSSIINQYAEEDVILLYFSDHALDIYNTDEDCCSHAKWGDKRSEYYGRQIPFMVYTSEKFRQNHKEITRMIENSINKSLNTTDLPYMLMQIMGVTFSDRPNKFLFI